jgi:glutamate-1-semialdehyde 2,1-aminomutase
MRRYKPERPADVCFARGTFNAHPAVMGAMNVFLRRLQTPEIQALYQDLDGRWNARLQLFNGALREAGLPMQAAALSSVWTLNFERPSRYHWLLQFYLREAGLALSWVGTGRLIFTLAHTDADMAEITTRFVAAARQMQADGWLWLPEDRPAPNFKRQVLRELLLQRLGWRR